MLDPCVVAFKYVEVILIFCMAERCLHFEQFASGFEQLSPKLVAQAVEMKIVDPCVPCAAVHHVFERRRGTGSPTGFPKMWAVAGRSTPFRLAADAFVHRRARCRTHRDGVRTEGVAAGAGDIHSSLSARRRNSSGTERTARNPDP
jgi:hypothetical protein